MKFFRSFEKREKMLTGAEKYGKLYFAQSEKQSRVSTLTIAQMSDYWFNIVTCRSFLYRICYVVRLGGYEIHSFFMLLQRET